MMATLASSSQNPLKKTLVWVTSVFGVNLHFVGELCFGGELKIGNIGVGGDVQEATKNPI